MQPDIAEIFYFGIPDHSISPLDQVSIKLTQAITGTRA